MRVQELMHQSPVSCGPDDTLVAAARLMWENDLGALPVVSEGAVQGVITDRDIAMAACLSSAPLHTRRVRDTCSGRVVAVQGDDHLETALELMAASQVRRLPVVDQHGRLVGMLGLGDLAANVGARKVKAAQVADALRAITRPRG